MAGDENYTRSARDELKKAEVERKALAARVKELRVVAKKEREETNANRSAENVLRNLLAWLRSLDRINDAVLAIRTALTSDELIAFKTWREKQKADRDAARKAKNDAKVGAEAQAVKKDDPKPQPQPQQKKK